MSARIVKAIADSYVWVRAVGVNVPPATTDILRLGLGRNKVGGGIPEFISPSQAREMLTAAARNVGALGPARRAVKGRANQSRMRRGDPAGPLDVKRVNLASGTFADQNLSEETSDMHGPSYPCLRGSPCHHAANLVLSTSIFSKWNIAHVSPVMLRRHELNLGFNSGHPAKWSFLVTWRPRTSPVPVTRSDEVFDEWVGLIWKMVSQKSGDRMRNGSGFSGKWSRRREATG